MGEKYGEMGDFATHWGINMYQPWEKLSETSGDNHESSIKNWSGKVHMITWGC